MQAMVLLCRSLTSSSLSSCNHSCEVSYKGAEKTVTDAALQPIHLQHDAVQKDDSPCDVGQHIASAALQQLICTDGSQCTSVDGNISQHLLDTANWQHSCSQISCKTKQHSLPKRSIAIGFRTSLQDQEVLCTGSVPNSSCAQRIEADHTCEQATAVPANAASADTSYKHDGQKDSAVFVQPYAGTGPEMPLLSAADRRQHKQALKAAQQVYAFRRHRMLWAGKL